MKALIFAAGLGTRLRPLTDDRPKALVEVAGVPMLEHVIRHLADAGFRDIVVNVHHFGQMIIDFLAARDNFGLNIAVSDERDFLLDTGGGILHARPLLDDGEPFLVHNADILTTLDLRRFYDSHRNGGALATLLVKHRDTQRYFVFDRATNRLEGWLNKATGETRPVALRYDAERQATLAFGGLHVISPEIFPLLQEHSRGERKFSITPFYIEQCAAHVINGYNPTGEDYAWLDVGKPDTLREAEVLFENLQRT